MTTNSHVKRGSCELIKTLGDDHSKILLLRRCEILTASPISPPQTRPSESWQPLFLLFLFGWEALAFCFFSDRPNVSALKGGHDKSFQIINQGFVKDPFLLLNNPYRGSFILHLSIPHRLECGRSVLQPMQHLLVQCGIIMQYSIHHWAPEYFWRTVE